jgi:sterol 3beta-glucosyltransferase
MPSRISRSQPKSKIFLAAGPAIYIGFGSMKWHTEQSTNAVFDAIAEWGGRALITSGWGGLTPPANLPQNIMFTGPVHHSLLFPRVSAVVHHGGAGMTAEGLRMPPDADPPAIHASI